MSQPQFKTISYQGIALDLTFWHTPEEPLTWDHPGAPEEVEVETVTVEGVDITPILHHETIKRIERALLEEPVEVYELERGE